MADLPAEVLVFLGTVEGRPAVVSSSTGIVWSNDAFARLVGRTDRELSGRQVSGLVHAESAAIIEDRLPPAQEIVQHAPADVLLVDGAGEPMLVRHSSRVFPVNGDRFTVRTFEPVTDPGRLRAALVASERRYRQLLDEDSTGRFVSTAEWRLLACNAALTQLLGYPENSPPIGRALGDFSADPLALHKLLTVARAEGRAGPADFELRRADGEQVEVSCRVTASTNQAGELVALHGQIIEITESKRLQMRLQGAERMELIGRLAGGLAHDFNNLLTIISGNSERLLQRLPAEDPMRASAAAIQQASERASSLTRQLLAFSRQQVFELRPVALQRLVVDSQPFLREILGDRVELQITAPDALPEISADARQIEHVIANLVVNAREAIAADGLVNITVDTLNVQEPAPRERVWLRPGRFVRLVVADSGRGMDAVTKAYAFQPFFTTKKMGDGRGLGLAMVYGIVKQSHGFVWVESEPGLGATFTLLFPVVERGAAERVAVRQPGGSETILIVDPDDQLRTLMRDALRRRGYDVLEAKSAADALAVFGATPSRIHLLLADVRADTDAGSPLAARLRAIDSRLQSLVMLEPVEPAEEDAPQRRVLPTTPSIQKPFTLQALSSKVRYVLDSGEGRG